MDSEPGPRAELYVRKELPSPAQAQATAVEQQLEEFVDRGVLGDSVRREWDKRVPVDGCDPEIRDTYLSFTAWARDRGVRLDPFFETRECYSSEHGGMTDWLVVPALCLAIYENGDLKAVYPHTDGTETLTVADGMEALQADMIGLEGKSSASAD